MRALRLVLLVVSFAASVAAHTQTATTVQPALAALAAPHAAELYAAGVQQIVASTGRQWLDIQILTSYGPSYISWPRAVTPTPFALDVGAGGALTVRAEGYTEANRARHAAAFDAILPEAVRLANESRAWSQRPRGP